ncbi:MAG: nitroreductase [Candidatus Omnitrophota bacterium]
MDGAGKNIVIENIKSRRSIRDFRQEGIPEEVIEKITEAGSFAPSALNRQPWKFIVVGKEAIIKELSSVVRKKLKGLSKLVPILRVFLKDFRDERFVNALKKTALSEEDTVFYNAPLIIFVANDTRYSSTCVDCVLACQNMMLTAHSMGVGSCFIGRIKAIPNRLLRKKFDLPGYYDFNTCMVFGYPKDAVRTPPARSRDVVARF